MTPQLIWIAFQMVFIGFSCGRAGESIPLRISPMRTSCMVLVEAALLYWGGFFNPLL